jgi:hypothetical protein
MKMNVRYIGTNKEVINKFGKFVKGEAKELDEAQALKLLKNKGEFESVVDNTVKEKK